MRSYSIARAVAGLALLLAACGGPAPAVRREPPVRAAPPPPPSPVAWSQQGMATFYAAHFAGRRTASGERYNPRALTAAHRTLPLGTVVRVLRVDDGGRPIAGPVVVRINDRGPYGGGRIIDLSYAAARRLDMVRAGVVRVRLEIVSRPTQ
jgi:peptidoglycan lytic transglycosylase